MWVARRSLSKATHPGMLDNMAAGGLASGYSAFETMIKECEEEASIPESLARQGLKCVGVVSFWNDRPISYESEPGLDYCYDLELPLDFVPVPADGEVQDFELMDLDQVFLCLEKGEFKPEAFIVCVDFLVRWGYFNCDLDGYLEMCCLLRRQMPFPSR